jgi:hypothetical protein
MLAQSIRDRCEPRIALSEDGHPRGIAGSTADQVSRHIPARLLRRSPTAAEGQIGGTQLGALEHPQLALLGLPFAVPEQDRPADDPRLENGFAERRLV